MAEQEKEGCPWTGCPFYWAYNLQASLREKLEKGLPGDFMGHINTARREVLLAVRSLIDRRLEALSQEPKRAGRRKTQKIKVE
ncbi:MAG: hypothetical protein HY998_02795 [candidate division NC10 bacterium]|nr:hypothetical protein [candidate division NC10 bacterium]